MILIAMIIGIITVIAEFIVVVYCAKRYNTLEKELARQVKLANKIGKENIDNEAKINKLEEENKKLKEENLEVNKCVRQQEKYVHELEAKNNTLQNAYDMLNEDTAKLMKERDTLQELVKTKDDEAEKPQETVEEKPEEPKKTKKRTTKKK